MFQKSHFHKFAVLILMYLSNRLMIPNCFADKIHRPVYFLFNFIVINSYFL
jgi:hypothetical protein